MSKKTKIVLIIIAVIVISVTGLVLLDRWISGTGEQEETETAQETGEASLPQQYPNNLIEGKIMEVDLEGKTLKLRAKTSLIETAKEELMEKTIRFTEETEWVAYNIISQEEVPYEFSEVEVDDNIVVVTVETTFDKINELEEFTATKISKIVSE